jgi:hypothetical protein
MVVLKRMTKAHVPSPKSQDLRPNASVFGLRSLVFGLRSLVFGRRSLVFGLWSWKGLCLLTLLTAGCGPGTSAGPQEPAAAFPLGVPDEKPEREVWEVHCIAGDRVGYSHTAEHRTARDGQPLVRIESVSLLRVLRAGQPMETKIELSSLETPEGSLLEFTCRIGQDAGSMLTEGRVAGERLEMKVTTKDKTTTSTIPWPADNGGFFIAEQSLRRQPMKPGERRTIHGFMPVDNQVTVTELTAREYQPVQLLDGTRELLRIDGETKVQGQSIRAASWCDRAGEILKGRADMLDMESYRTTKEAAVAASGPPKVDVIGKMAVPVDRALGQPHDTKRIRYRVRLEGGDPAGVFVVGPTQAVRSIDAHTAEITVVSCRLSVDRPQSGSPTTANRQLPTDNRQLPTDNCSPGDREPNNFIQSDNPKIVAAARKAAGDIKDPWQAAVALERATRELITKPDYSQAFASAAEVIETGVGDCTEHAVLLAALARARGIPARVATGLIYTDRKFLYHMWTEVFVDGRWIPLDGTLARGGIGAAHLKLSHSNLQGASAFSSMLPVAQVAGRLAIEIVDVE